MRPKLARLAALCGLLALPSASPGQPPTGANPFERYDANKDGKVTRDEVPERLRDRFDAIDANKDGLLTPQEHRSFLAGRAGSNAGVEVKQDLPYAGTTNPRQTLDLLLPKIPKADKPLPVLVNIHGGGWMAGDKSGGVGSILPLVASGEYAGVTINYRLTDEASWPAQAFDCKAAIRWVRGHATEFHLDPDRIGVIGGSAGGHLVALLGSSGGVESLEGELGPFAKLSSRVTCVVDMYGPADLLAMGDPPGFASHNRPGSPESKLVGGPIQERKDVAKAASPITYVAKGDPAFLIIHGDKDPTVSIDQSVRLDKALREAGVDVTFIKVEGGGHGGFRNPEIPRRIRLFFDKHLKGIDSGPISAGPVPNAATPSPK